MRRDHYAFGYGAAPADERPTGFGQTNFDQSSLALMSTQPAPWNISQPSTFEEPSRSADQGEGAKRHARQVKAGVAAMLVLGLAALVTTIAIALR